MSIGLTMKTLAVLALVAAATAVIVQSEHHAATPALWHSMALHQVH